LQLLVSLAATVKSEALAVNEINSAVNGVEKICLSTADNGTAAAVMCASS
jgi:hypothetical protein